MTIKQFFNLLRSPECFKAMRLLVFLAVMAIVSPLYAAGQHPTVPKLTLSQVEQLVSNKVPDSTLSSQIQRRGLAFKPSAADLDALRAKGAGPLTIAAVEALLPNTALGARPNKISATTDPSGAFISLLEQNWNWQSHWRVFLGPTYFGTATSFGRGAMGTLRYSLAETSDYPVFRSLASKGLITLSNLSIADAPTSLAPGVNIKIDFGAIVTLTQAGVRSGKVDEKERNVTFAFGTYGVEKIASNTRVLISEDDYRLVEGTYVLNIAPEFDDVWGERGWSRHRDFQFRALFRYDSAGSKWEIANASAGYGERAMDTGPRGGNFESEKVPQTLDQLRIATPAAVTPSAAPYANNGSANALDTLQALETTECTEGEQTVPVQSQRVFVVSPLRECWTPWLVLEGNFLKIHESGNLLLQFAFRDGTVGDAFEDGPRMTFNESKPIRKVRFKSLRKEAVTITMSNQW